MSKILAKFHDVNEVPHGVFSPLSPHPFVVRHVTYPSLHHFFLCERFKASPVDDEIRKASSLWEVDRLVRKAESQGWQREDWDRVKADVMLLGCYYKMKHNPDVATVLQQTGQRTILYTHAQDDFWGDGGDGQGKNLLGVILMAVRKRIAHEDRTSRKRGGGDIANSGSGAHGRTRR